MLLECARVLHKEPFVPVLMYDCEIIKGYALCRVQGVTTEYRDHGLEICVV